MKMEKFVDDYCGVNSYVVSDDDTKKCMVVDPGGSLENISNYIKKNDLVLEYIVLTHGHGDHIGYVMEIKNKTGAKVVANKNEKEMLNDKDKNLSSRMKCGAQEFDADIYVDDKDTLKLGNLSMRFIHTPGHTQGGMCIRFGDDMITGDTLFAGSIGRTDLFGGDFKAMEKSLKKLCKFEDNVRVYPGHGPASTLGIEKQSNPYLR